MLERPERGLRPDREEMGFSSNSHRLISAPPKRKNLSARPTAYRSAASPQASPMAADAATRAVAGAFARLLAERYPGTSWLPVKRGDGDGALVVPAGKVLRLLPGEADAHALGRGRSVPAASGRASHEDGSDTCA